MEEHIHWRTNNINALEHIFISQDVVNIIHIIKIRTYHLQHQDNTCYVVYILTVLRPGTLRSRSARTILAVVPLLLLTKGVILELFEHVSTHRERRVLTPSKFFLDVSGGRPGCVVQGRRCHLANTALDLVVACNATNGLEAIVAGCVSPGPAWFRVDIVPRIIRNPSFL